MANTRRIGSYAQQRKISMPESQVLSSIGTTTPMEILSISGPIGLKGADAIFPPEVEEGLVAINDAPDFSLIYSNARI